MIGTDALPAVDTNKNEREDHLVDSGFTEEEQAMDQAVISRARGEAGQKTKKTSLANVSRRSCQT